MKSFSTLATMMASHILSKSSGYGISYNIINSTPPDIMDLAILPATYTIVR